MLTFQTRTISFNATTCQVICDRCGTLAPEHHGVAKSIGEALLAGWVISHRREELLELRHALVLARETPIEWPCVCPNCEPDQAAKDEVLSELDRLRARIAAMGS